MGTHCEDSILIFSRDEAISMNTKEILNALSETGFIIFKEGAKNVFEFSEFIRSHSSRISIDPARNIKGSAQLVDAGTDAVGLHCENGNSPFWPDLTWFYCEIAPNRGSQTIVCDGLKVFKHFSQATREFLLDNKICYSRSVSEDKWKKLVCHYNSWSDNIDKVNFDDLKLIMGKDKSTKIELQKDKSISYKFTVSPIQVSKICNKSAFANSILGPSFNYEKPIISIAHTGEPIPSEIICEIEKLTELHTLSINWQNSDFVLIDNRRVMHGRRRIVDGQRKIYNALSYI